MLARGSSAWLAHLLNLDCRMFHLAPQSLEHSVIGNHERDAKNCVSLRLCHGRSFEA